MAEFQEVTKLWRRMCISMDGNDPYQKCERCLLGEEHICSFEISDIQDDELHRVEETVMAWAAEHPEPVYPTWGEWLMQLGVIGRTFQDMPNPYFAEAKAASPIPADIAQKLGLQPKEG